MKRHYSAISALCAATLLVFASCGSDTETLGEKGSGSQETDPHAGHDHAPGEGHDDDPGEERPNPEPSDFASIVTSAKAALTKHYGTDLSSLTIREATRDEMRAVLLANTSAPLPPGSPSPLSKEQEVFLSTHLLGIFDFSESKDILICTENFKQLSVVLELPELTLPETLFAVLVHEGAHAVADQRFGLTPFFTTAFTAGEDAKLAADSVVEGYAQHIAQTICAAEGKSKGFDTFTGSITAMPKDLDPGMEAFMKVMITEVSFSYIEGHKFAQTVFAALGDKAEARMFESPPSSRMLVGRPAWYLNPEMAPEAEVNLIPALELIKPYFGEFKTMQFTLRQASDPEIRASLAIVGEEKIQTVSDAVLEYQTHVGVTPGGENLAIVALIHTVSEEGAEDYLRIVRETHTLKDEQMKGEGQIQIVSSEITEADPDLGIGFRGNKLIRFNNQDVPVRTASIRRGRVVLELTLSNLNLPEPQIREMLMKVLDRAVPVEAAIPSEK